MRSTALGCTIFVLNILFVILIIGAIVALAILSRPNGVTY